MLIYRRSYISMLIFMNTVISFGSYFFVRDGPNKWRDQSLPVDILNEWLKVKSYPDAEWAPDRKSVTINGHEYTLDHFG